LPAKPQVAKRTYQAIDVVAVHMGNENADLADFQVTPKFDAGFLHHSQTTTALLFEADAERWKHCAIAWVHRNSSLKCNLRALSQTLQN